MTQLASSPLGKICIVNVHLDHAHQSKRKELLEQVLTWLEDKSRKSIPALICGDFNVCGRRNITHYNDIKKMLVEKAGFERLKYTREKPNTSTPATFVSQIGPFTLDYAFVRGQITGVVEVISNKELSDHSALVITLKPKQ